MDYFFGASSLGLGLELSLGFIVLSVPGAFDVSVVEPLCVESTGPVDGAAGLVEPVSLRGGLMSDGEEGRRIELSLSVRPLARRFDFIIAPCLLQSHSQFLSFAILSEDATSRLVAVDDELLDIEPRSEVLLSVEVPAFGIAWPGMSFLVALLVELGRSSVVCAIAAGAASASDKIEVATSFIVASREVYCSPVTVATTCSRDNDRPLV